MVDRTLYIVFSGEPPIQERPRGTYLRGQGRLIMYDPTSRVKQAVQVLLRHALDEIDAFEAQQLDTVFEPSARLKVRVQYYLHDDRKDIDNLLKFTFDVMQGIVFANDRFICEVEARKTTVGEPEARADLEISVVN